MSDRLNLKVCWNCKSYDVDTGSCGYYNILQQATDTCNNFQIDYDITTIDNLKDRIDELENSNNQLQKYADKLERLECAGVDNWENYSYAMSDEFNYDE